MSIRNRTAPNFRNKHHKPAPKGFLHPQPIPAQHRKAKPERASSSSLDDRTIEISALPMEPPELLVFNLEWMEQLKAEIISLTGLPAEVLQPEATVMPQAETLPELMALAATHGTAVTVVTRERILEGEILPPSTEEEKMDKAMRQHSERVRQHQDAMMIAAMMGIGPK